MEFTYPIQAILLYLSLLFAPSDAERIVFKGVDHSGVLIRDDSGWNRVGTEGNIPVSIDGTRLVSGSKRESLALELVEYVPGLAGHDWEKQPKLTLPDASVPHATTIEKTPDGFKLHHNRGTQGIYRYTITYVRNNPAGGPACTVLGAVKKPGIVVLETGDTLRSVILRAGGPAGEITPPLVWLARGTPGEKFSHREGFDLSGVLEGRHENVELGDRDVLYIEPTLLLEIAADGSLVLDGRPCPASSLAPLLREGIAAGVRSATLRSHPDTPYERISPLVDTFTATGIPADRLKFTVGGGD